MRISYAKVGDRLIAECRPQEQGNKYYYYTSDQINSIRMITNDSGTVVYSTTYDPYGGIQKTWVNSYDPKLKFSGKERDGDSGLDYFGARYYGHSSYRFISVDPVMNRVDLLALSSNLDNPIGIGDNSLSNSKTDITRNYFIDTQDALSNPQLWNLYSFNRNNPLIFSDPTGLSYLHFSRSSQKLILYDSIGKKIGSWDASNNASGGHDPFPLGKWNYVWWSIKEHKSKSLSDPISSSGNYIFDVRKEGYGVHAGQKGKADPAGRIGWQHATHGCIRTIEEAMTAIRERFSKKDPLTHILVEK